MEWKPIPSAPYGHDIELAVIDRDGTHALIFACRRGETGWIKSDAGKPVEVHPTHWREWSARTGEHKPDVMSSCRL